MTAADRDLPLIRSRLMAGTELNGIFVIDAPLASGGMGEVYRGHNIQTGDRVAIKVIRSDLAENETALALFRKEASALHNLSHEAIVRYFVFSVDPRIQRAYLAMEYVEGTSIEDMIAGGQRLPVEDVARLMRRIAVGLEVAHELGIVHRDISPDNIILPAGEVRKAKIIDFGIARSTRLGGSTVIGSGFAGKYNFVSPEQLGLYDGDVRAPSDIYSLGLVMAAALRGEPIDMGGSQVEVIEKRRRIPGLDGVDPRLAPLIARMLEPDPALRLQSMHEVAQQCEAVLDMSASGAGPARDHTGDVPPRARLKLSQASLYGGLGLALLALVGGSLYMRGKKSKAISVSDSRPTLETAGVPERPTAAPAPAPPKPPDTPDIGEVTIREKIERFVAIYDGGDCVWILPGRVIPSRSLPASTATLTVVAAKGAATTDIGQAFRRALGFDATITVKSVTPSQCAAVRFLARTRFEKPLTPQIDVNVTELRNGQYLTGTASAPPDAQMEILAVGEDGFVQNVTSLLRATNQKSFNIHIQRPASASPQPQLLLAVATSKPVAALKFEKPAHADTVFSAVAADAVERGVAMAAAVEHVLVLPPDPGLAGKRQADPVRVATTDDAPGALAGLAPGETAFSAVRKDQSPELLWNPDRREVIAGDAVIAQDVARDDIPAIVDRLVAVREIKRLTAQSPQPIALMPRGGLHHENAEIAVVVDNVARRALILLNIASNGTVQFLYPIGSDSKIVEDAMVRIRFRVEAPFGADLMLAITASQPMPELEAAFNRFNRRATSGQILKVISSYAPRDARFGSVSLFTTR